MRKSLLTATAGLAALALTSPGPTVAQGEADQQLGNVSFETSCNAVAQRRFNRAKHDFLVDVLVAMNGIDDSQ